jgi:hypothetical protein
VIGWVCGGDVGATPTTPPPTIDRAVLRCATLPVTQMHGVCAQRGAADRQPDLMIIFFVWAIKMSNQTET